MDTKNESEYLSFSDEFLDLIAEIINHQEYQRLKNYQHHDKSIYDHNIMVAWFSYKVARQFNLDLCLIVKGSLLHDFFHYDWREEKQKTGRFHTLNHPFLSAENAERIYGRLTKKERDIIVKHMWPVTLMPPRYIESLIVCLVDKFVATLEYANHYKNRLKRSIKLAGLFNKF